MDLDYDFVVFDAEFPCTYTNKSSWGASQAMPHIHFPNRLKPYEKFTNNTKRMFTIIWDLQWHMKNEHVMFALNFVRYSNFIYIYETNG